MNYDEINLLIVGDLYIDESKASYIAMGYKRYLEQCWGAGAGLFF